MKESLTDKVYTLIIDSIISNEFPNDQLINEKQLMNLYSVSRAPIREALIKLCNECIVKGIPRAGYQILAVSPKRISDAIEMRKILEIENLKSISTNLNLRSLQAILKKLKEQNYTKSKPAKIECWYNNSAFHLELCKLGDNLYLFNSVEKMTKLLWIAAAQFFQGHNEYEYFPFMSETVEEHINILSALIDGNTEHAINLLTDDIYSLKKKFQIL